MIRLFYFISFFAICEISFAQTKPKPPISNSLKQPKLVIGIVVDQMRQDYIYRYWNKFGNGGFKKLINEGFFYKNLNRKFGCTVENVAKTLTSRLTTDLEFDRVSW